MNPRPPSRLASAAREARRRRAGALSGLLLAFAGPATAATCPVDDWLPWPAPAAAPAVAGPGDPWAEPWPGPLDGGPWGGQVDAFAATVDLADPDVVALAGDVLVRDAGHELRAGSARFTRSTERVAAREDVRFRTRELALVAEAADVSLTGEPGHLDDVAFRFRRGAGRGTAERAELLSETRSRLEDVVFTTCPGQDPDWELAAREMTLDQATGRGKARNVRLRFKDATLLALPRAAFPLDDRRQSGFLLPGLGGSSDNGIDVSLPYYWNIAPNRDASFTPRLISDRGVLLGAEYRYLHARSVGEIDGAYLPEDDLTGRDRGRFGLRHRSLLGDGLRFVVDVNHVSDRAWFEDFGGSLTVTAVSVLRSVVSLQAQGPGFEAELLADAYQTIDQDIPERNEPYDRLPRGWIRAVRPIGSLFEVGLEAEAVRFDRATGVQGSRLDVYPFLATPIVRPGWYLTPTLGVRHTAYRLDQDEASEPDRTTPIVSVEGGLIFDRRLANGRLQTLEPRLHYLSVPFRDQGELPAFDTAEFTFGFNQLFRTNRFTGADRQADANQLGVGLTSRLFAGDGAQELVTASIGTIVYFEDQQVQLGNRPPREDDTSPIVTELQLRPSAYWRATLGFQYDPEDREFDQSIAAFQVRRPAGSILNVAYRQRDDRVQQFDLSFFQPVGERWTAIGRLNYSFLEDTDLETLLGVQYESCCWAARAFARRYLRNQAGDKRNGLFFELELKGLGALGRASGRLLEQAIVGYRSEDYR